MQRRMRFRMIVFICFIVAMMAVFALRLYKLQTAELVTADADSMTYRTTMEASRGNILDRNGNVLVSNRASALSKRKAQPPFCFALYGVVWYNKTRTFREGNCYDQ